MLQHRYTPSSSLLSPVSSTDSESEAREVRREEAAEAMLGCLLPGRRLTQCSHSEELVDPARTRHRHQDSSCTRETHAEEGPSCDRPWSWPTQPQHADTAKRKSLCSYKIVTAVNSRFSLVPVCCESQNRCSSTQAEGNPPEATKRQS